MKPAEKAIRGLFKVLPGAVCPSCGKVNLALAVPLKRNRLCATKPAQR